MPDTPQGHRSFAFATCRFAYPMFFDGPLVKAELRLRQYTDGRNEAYMNGVLIETQQPGPDVRDECFSSCGLERERKLEAAWSFRLLGGMKAEFVVRYIQFCGPAMIERLVEDRPLRAYMQLHPEDKILPFRNYEFQYKAGNR